jgi:hypothetical protein
LICIHCTHTRFRTFFAGSRAHHFRADCNQVLRLIQPVAVEVPGLVTRTRRLAAGVQEVLEQIVPQSEQVADEGSCFPAEVGDELLKLAGEADFVVVVQVGDLNPVFAAADRHRRPPLRIAFYGWEKIFFPFFRR